jgi:TrpR-related protein YerC/YecD
MKDMNNQLEILYEALLNMKSVEDCKALLDDLCTYKEVEQMAQRAYAAKLFLEGKTYNEIIAETELSSTTLSRVSRAISHGSGGYAKLINYDNKDDKNK